MPEEDDDPSDTITDSPEFGPESRLTAACAPSFNSTSPGNRYLSLVRYLRSVNSRNPADTNALLITDVVRLGLIDRNLASPVLCPAPIIQAAVLAEQSDSQGTVIAEAFQLLFFNCI